MQPRCEADVHLYDANGKVAASLDGQGQLWDNDGKVVGTIKATPSGPAAVYSNEGKQVGWFKAGAYHDMEGFAVFAVTERHMLVTEVPPIASVKEVAPVAPIPEVAQVAPVLRDEFAPAPAKTLLPSAVSVEAHFTPSKAGRDVVTNSFRIADGLASLRERRQATNTSSGDHALVMAQGAAEIAEMRQLIELRRQEIKHQEAQLAKSAIDQEREIAGLRMANLKLTRQAENQAVLWAEPSGPMLAVQPIPELGLKQGDVFRTQEVDEDGAVQCTLDDNSLEWAIVHAGECTFGANTTRTVEPIEIIVDRIRGGKLHKLSSPEFEALARESGQRLLEALRAHRRLSQLCFFQVTDDIRDESLKKGALLRFKGVEIDGAHFTQLNERWDEVVLPPVPMATVIQWLDGGRIIEKSML